MKEVANHTRSILEKLAPKYLRGTLIDVGAGKGKYRDLLAPYIATYTPIDDLSSDYQFKSASDAESINVADASKLPFPDRSFDSALCTKLIEHVENPAEVMREISRVLKPGGYLILSSDWFTPYHREPKDYWRFSVDGYQYLAHVANLEWVECYQQGGTMTAIHYIFWRTIELHGGKFGRRAYRFFEPVRNLGERLFGWIDHRLKTPDGVGHVVVLRKP